MVVLRITGGEQAATRCESKQITRNRTIKRLTPSARRIYHQRPILRLDKRSLADTEAAGLSLMAAVCPAGERGAGAKWTREGQPNFDQVFVVGRKMMLAQLWLWWLCGAPKKERKGTVIREKCVTSTVYLHTQPTYDTSLFSFGETFFVGTSILCQHLIHDVATCLLHFG